MRISKTEQDHFPVFYIMYGSKNIEIATLELEVGQYNIFLPSYINPHDLQVKVGRKTEVELGGVLLSNKMSCDSFELGKKYSLVVNQSYMGELQFYKSENVATMFIDTSSGNMDDIHENQENIEYTSIALYTKDGQEDFKTSAATLKGRGNFTWRWDKKSYVLSLLQSENLLNMGSSNKWILLSNAVDESNIRNKLVYDVASEIGFAGPTQCSYVDLYLNGEYNGLYLLVKKIDSVANELGIDLRQGDFLCKIDMNDRWEKLESPFESSMGRTVEIALPAIVTENEQARIKGLVDEMEYVLASDTSFNSDEVVDIDSWATRYLVDEIFGNIDSDIASSYFYYSNGKYYAGPLWDYDMILGNYYRNADPYSFIAKNVNKSVKDFSLYNEALYDSELFYERMVEIYEESFLPVLMKKIDKDVHSLTEDISDASKMNSIRWEYMYKNFYESGMIIPTTTDEIVSYLNSRVNFLNSAWIKGVRYYTVQFEFTPGGMYHSVSIAEGDLLESKGSHFIDYQWVNKETGQKFDHTQPIYSDMILTLDTEM